MKVGFFLHWFMIFMHNLIFWWCIMLPFKILLIKDLEPKQCLSLYECVPPPGSTSLSPSHNPSDQQHQSLCPDTWPLPHPPCPHTHTHTHTLRVGKTALYTDQQTLATLCWGYTDTIRRGSVFTSWLVCVYQKMLIKSRWNLRIMFN